MECLHVPCIIFKTQSNPGEIGRDLYLKCSPHPSPPPTNDEAQRGSMDLPRVPKPKD